MKDEHFFIVGAQRSGTTYLYQLCTEHPQIEMAQPIKPEPKFFLNDPEFELGLDHYQKKYFKEKKGAVIFGEKSTSYIEVEKAAGRIAQSFPSAKIVFIFRDPVERAVSNYWFSVKNGFETLPIEEAFYKEDQRWRNYNPAKISVSPFAYLRRGRYINYIEMYQKYFPSNQIHVVIQEQIIRSTQPLHDLYSFLGVEPSYCPEALYRVINANETRLQKELDSDLEKYLQRYFSDTTAALALRLKMPLTEWKSYNQRQPHN
jgi:hypothetical protein